MKHIILLSSIIFITTCSGGSSFAPTCDTASTLTHKVTGKANTRGTEYHVSISINGVALDAIADTGSANLIVANNIGFTPTGTAGQQWTMYYGDSTAPTTTINVTDYTGTVDLNCESGVKNFEYGYTTGFSSTDGSTQLTILGLAYRSVEHHAAGQNAAPTFFSQLVTATGMNDEFAMLLCGANNSHSGITFGGTGTSTKAEAFQYVPIINKSYYVINAGAVTMNGVSMGTLNNGNQTVLDSGTSINLVPQAMYNAIVAHLPVGVSVGTPGQSTACPSQAQIASMSPVQIALDNNVTLSISPSTYFKQLGDGSCFFGFAPGGSLNILGQVTMENYHVHFDRKNTRIGFSPNTACKG